MQQLLLASETINDKSKLRTVSNSPAETQPTTDHQGVVSLLDPFAKYYEGSYVSDKLTMYDFLCDANDSYFHNAGNRRLRVMVAMRLQAYEQLSNFQRMLFIQDFLRSLSGVVRFIALDSSVGKWRLLKAEFAMQVIQKHFDECLRIQYSSQGRCSRALKFRVFTFCCCLGSGLLPLRISLEGVVVAFNECLCIFARV